MSNSDFFSLFSEDEQSSESLTSFFELEQVPTFSKNGVIQNKLESLDDIFSNLAFNADEQPSLFDDLENQAENQLAEQLKEIPRSPKKSELSPLTPPFLVEIQECHKVLIEAEQQLEGQARRSRSTDQLINQQAEELIKIQEQLAYTVAERQVYQEEAQRQQLQIENFAEKIAITQTQTAQLERECSHLQENFQEKRIQVKFLEDQLEELQARLQRQQRYSLQYKKALEQCLATPNWNPSSDVTLAIASLMGQIKPIQPWSNQQLEDSTQFQLISKNLGENLENAIPETSPLIALTEDLAKIATNENQKIVAPPEVIQLQSETPEPELIDNFPPKRDRSFLSFAINSPSQTTRRPVDLPKFMRQASVTQ